MAGEMEASETGWMMLQDAIPHGQRWDGWVIIIHPMEQAQFILKSLFIVRPNPTSHYKLRIIINRDSQEQEVKREKQKYQFTFPAGNGVQFQQPFGAIILLERPGDSPSDERFLQIGKANVDFNEVLMQGPSKQPSLNGVIYGSRASNYDKVIAKYAYEVAKRKVQFKSPLNNQAIPPSGNTRKLKFKDHLQKEKLPVLKFKQSILERSSAINARIRELSQNITIPEEGYEKDEVTLGKTTAVGQKSHSLKGNLSMSNYSFNQGKGMEDFAYRLNEKVERAIQDHQYKEIKWMLIKTIKIFPGRKGVPLSNQPILLKIQDHYHFRLADLILPFENNSNNTLRNLPIPIPATSNYLAISVTYQQGSWQTLQGYTRIVHSITKTVELYSDSNEEQGFISLEVLKNSDNSFDLEDYQAQKANFSNLAKKFPIVSTKPLLHVAINPKRQQPHELYQSFQKKRNSDGLVNSRRSIALSNHNYSQQTDQSKSRSKRFRRPKHSLQISDLPSTAKTDLSTSTRTLSLKIKNIYIHLYDFEASDDFRLKFQANGQVETVDLGNGYSDLQETPILLTDLDPTEAIKVNCYQRSSHNLLGSSLVSVQTLIKSSTGQFKIFLSRHDILVGYVSCDISLYRIKNNQIRAIRKQQPLSTPIYTAPNQEYELSFAPETVSYINSLSPPSRQKNKYDPSASFLVQQQNFH